jgi:hypothetical protein
MEVQNNYFWMVSKKKDIHKIYRRPDQETDDHIGNTRSFNKIVLDQLGKHCVMISEKELFYLN